MVEALATAQQLEPARCQMVYPCHPVVQAFSLKLVIEDRQRKCTRLQHCTPDTGLHARTMGGLHLTLAFCVAGSRALGRTAVEAAEQQCQAEGNTSFARFMSAFRDEMRFVKVNASFLHENASPSRLCSTRGFHSTVRREVERENKERIVAVVPRHS